MAKLHDAIMRLIGFVLAILTAQLAILVIGTVFLRYVFNVSFIQSEEAITMTFIAICFIGAAYASFKEEHIVVSAVYEKMTARIRKVTDLMILLVTLVVEVVVLQGSFSWLSNTGDMLLPGLRLPAVYFYALVPLCAILIIVESVIRLISIIANQPLNPDNMDA